MTEKHFGMRTASKVSSEMPPKASATIHGLDTKSSWLQELSPGLTQVLIHVLSTYISLQRIVFLSKPLSAVRSTECPTHKMLYDQPNVQ